MAKILRSNLATALGISKAAISQAIKRGDLILGVDGYIDTEDPKNKTWIEGPHKRGKAAAPAAPKVQAKRTPKKKPIQDTVSPTASPADLAEDDPDLAEGLAEKLKAVVEEADEKRKYLVARRLDIEAATRLKAIKEDEEKGRLIERELVRRQWAQFDAALKTVFREMPRRIAAQVFAVAKSGTARDVEAYLEREIGEGLRRTTEEGTR